MPYVNANGLNLYYETFGDPGSPPVLLISGLGGDHRGWKPLAQFLQDSFRVIVFDNRDSGLSQRAQTPYAIRDMAEDAVGVLGELGIARTHVVGYSMGGAIAQEIAIEFPHIVDRLTLLATYDAGDPRGSALFRGFASLRRDLPRDEYIRLSIPWVYTHAEYEVEGFIEQLISDGMEDHLYQESDAYERQMEATIAYHSRDRLHRISCPTLLIFGEDDVMTPMRFARSMVKGIAGSRLVIMEGTGHAVRRTRAAEVAGLTHAFLSDDQAPAGTEQV